MIIVCGAAELAIGTAGSALFLIAGSSARLMFYDQFFRAGLLAVLTTVVAVPALASKHLVLPDRGVLAAGILTFAIEALYNNLSHAIGYGTARILDDLGFACLLFSLAFVALRLVLANERRLFAVENEPSVAREIQRSILPSSIPKLTNARISAAYCPMNAVAGDVYEFIPIDRDRVAYSGPCE
jgi:phosphoserine phosphatase RsbU/P